MAHESSCEDIIWNIDFINQVGSSYKIIGWIASKTSKIIGLQLNKQNISYDVIDRPDVKNVYPFLQTSHVGVEFIINKEDIKKSLQIIVKGDVIAKVYNIGSLEHWFVIKSGFTNASKSLIIVDNFYNDPDIIRDYVIKKVKFDYSEYHTGKRSLDRFILEGTKEKFEELLGCPILNWNHPNYANGKFQYCTSYDHVVYHIDTQNYAAMVYLTPDAPLQTGTASYRSKLTGATRFDNGETGELYQKTFKGVSNELNFYDKTSWEEVDRVANVYNRLVMFDSKRLHSATEYFGDALENARLFHLFFFDI